MKIERISDNRLDFTLTGKLDAERMRSLLDEFFEKSEGMEHGQMLYVIKDFEWPSLSALAVEMRYMPRLFGLISRIDRVAVLTDTDWIRKAALIEGKLIPGITIKDFDLDEHEKAEKWLAAG
ncbi:STAS/SEC14 domain-containing protein [Pseudahrensia aquimaris]|uniref:STAS/SEC14 domain-containing protein n=1 Tax=Pseudahrensia aquimaris TaxID=744461 RepID=A0ABW3FET3_9HYPH